MPLHAPVSLLLLVMMSLLSADASAIQKPRHEGRVDKVFADIDKTDSPGCAAAVVIGGVVDYAHGYGMANLEYGIPITPSSVFHVGSVSKQFTALAVALLGEEGKISWDDDIRAYVPEVPDYGSRIALRHLAQHTSGLRDQWDLLQMAGWRWEADVVTQDDVLEIVSRQRALNFLPGDEYLYSNTGYTLLAAAVERVSGQTLREFSDQRIFRPLGMADTHFHDDHQMIVENRAYAYAPDSLDRLKISIPDFDVVGASSLFTTVEDLARWDRNFYTGQVGGLETLRLMHTRGMLNGGEPLHYTYGLDIGRYRGLKTVGHAGADAGYRSYFVRFPEHDFSVAVLCNFPQSAPWERVEQIADVYLADAFILPPPSPGESDPEAVDVPESQLTELQGYYLAPHTDLPLHVELRERVLYVGWPSGPELIPVGDYRFRLRGSSTVVSFARGKRRRAMTLAMPHGFSMRVYERAEPADTSPEALAEYTGTYSSDELGVVYSVRVGEDGIFFWTRKHGRVPLVPTYRDGFISKMFALSFTRDAEGRVDGFTISSPRVRKVRFIRSSGS